MHRYERWADDQFNGYNIDVAGTVTRRDSAVSTVHNTSSRSVTGLATGSTQRTVNGIARGEESTSGKTDPGAMFTATRLIGDTTAALVIPGGERQADLSDRRQGRSADKGDGNPG